MPTPQKPAHPLKRCTLVKSGEHYESEDLMPNERRPPPMREEP